MELSSRIIDKVNKLKENELAIKELRKEYQKFEHEEMMVRNKKVNTMNALTNAESNSKKMFDELCKMFVTEQ